ncbi:MAG: LysE family translocator [Halomonas sp.]
MPLTLWLSLAAICAMGAMSPGPSLALVLRHTLGGGRLFGVIAAIFHTLGVGFYALLTVWGLGALIAGFPMLFQLITWCGAAYLAWLGFQALRAGKAGALHPAAMATSRGQAAKEGVRITAIVLSLLLTAMVIDGGWYVLVAVVLSHSRILPWLQKNAHWINRITGVLLIVLALRVVAGPLV